MKLEIDLSANFTEPYVVIHTGEITKDIRKLCNYIQNLEAVIAVYENDNIVILQPEDIYMIVSKSRSVDVFCKEKQYVSKKCLYEFEDILRHDFMRISKTTIINLKQIDRVEPSFNGMLIVLKNGKKDYISRKYLPEFKKYLGL